MLFRIGEFSKKTNISVKTLRYYDKIELFKPVEIDIYTQYRYYSEDQLNDLKLIKELQNLGFSLNEIKDYWNNFTDDILLKKRTLMLNEIQIKTENIKKIDYMRSTLSNGKFTSNTNDKTNIKVKSL